MIWFITVTKKASLFGIWKTTNETFFHLLHQQGNFRVDLVALREVFTIHTLPSPHIYCGQSLKAPYVHNQSVITTRTLQLFYPDSARKLNTEWYIRAMIEGKQCDSVDLIHIFVIIINSTSYWVCFSALFSMLFTQIHIQCACFL